MYYYTDIWHEYLMGCNIRKLDFQINKFDSH